MRGNSHVRFLGGRGRVTARAYPAWLWGAYRLATRWPEGSLRVALGGFSRREGNAVSTIPAMIQPT